MSGSRSAGWWEVEDSCSPWVSPVVLDRKRARQRRSWSDSGHLGSVAEKGSHPPLPRLDVPAGSSLFSTLDFFQTTRGRWTRTSGRKQPCSSDVHSGLTSSLNASRSWSSGAVSRLCCVWRRGLRYTFRILPCFERSGFISLCYVFHGYDVMFFSACCFMLPGESLLFVLSSEVTPCLLPLCPSAASGWSRGGGHL